MKHKQPDNTLLAIVIIVLVFACIIGFFATHQPNSNEEMEFNSIIDRIR